MAEEFSIDIDLLISLVEQRPVLWDKSIELYKNRVATEANWKEIIMILNPGFQTMEEKTRQGYAKLVIQKWTHIRDTYSRSIKKIQDQKRFGNCSKTAKPYIYSKQLSFLRKVTKLTETVTNFVIENSNTKFEDQINNLETNEGINENTTMINDTPTSQNTINKRIPKRPQKNNVNPIDAKMIKFMDSFAQQKPTVINRHLSFFHGILPTLEKFDDNQVLDFQMGVLQLLKDIKDDR